MNKSLAQQIDDGAQAVFQSARPKTWVVNEQSRDFGKDYLVEIGNDDGSLSGSAFYVQLKGHQRATISADGQFVKHLLETKHAAYYLDKVTDLPVFLVVVDVGQGIGWWLFLQESLQNAGTWRKKKSVTCNVPVGNVLTDLDKFRQAVADAKQWIRRHHPESIRDAVVAHKERLRQLDPRFEFATSLENDNPVFNLLAKENVPLTLKFLGDREVMNKKIVDLFDKGTLVSFEAGEVRFIGSKLFEQFEHIGFSMQTGVRMDGALRIVCLDAEGKEIAQLSDLPGRFEGGRSHYWFEGAFSNSPLLTRVGPFSPDVAGSISLSLDLRRWEGQQLRKLAYFDRLHTFFQALPKTKAMTVECQHDGNTFLTIPVQFPAQPVAQPTADYLETIRKARKVTERFNADPVWTFTGFDQDARDTAEELFGVFFEDGWKQKLPGAKINMHLVRRSFRREAWKLDGKTRYIRHTAAFTYSLLGIPIAVGRLARDYSEMTIRFKDQRKVTGWVKSRKDQNRKQRRSARGIKGGDTVAAICTGTDNTVLTVHRIEETDGTP